MPLRNTQRVFYQAISTSTTSCNDAIDLIKKTEGLSPQKRLDIYRNTMLSSKIKALQQIYPVCESILGTRLFNRLANDYTLDHASHSNDLNLYGEKFADAIDEAVQIYRELAEFQYLYDLCQLEWLWHKVYFQQNDQPFDFDAFKHYSQTPHQVSLSLSYSVETMITNYPIHLIWQQHCEQKAEDSVTGLEEVEYLCISRQEFMPKITTISKAQFALLNACNQGDSLAEMAIDTELSTVLHALPEMIKLGWISGFTYHPDKPELHV